MKVVILAGGLGSRISEESYVRPKPMIEVGGMPILWHIMKIYSSYGFNEFIVCLGYKGHVIKQFFSDYYLRKSDVTFCFDNEGDIKIHKSRIEPWKVTLVDTGLGTQTGGRIKKIQEYIGKEKFMLTYGDGVSDIDIQRLLEFHNEHGKILTTTAVQPHGSYGVIQMSDKDGKVSCFAEKRKEDCAWINAGFMVVEPEIFKYLSDSEDCVFEKQPLEKLCAEGQMMAYKHNGFWQCMDTKCDRERLEKLWNEGGAPWKVWS